MRFPVDARRLKIFGQLKLLISTSLFNTASGAFSGFITVYFARYLKDETDIGSAGYGIILSIGISLYLITVIVSGAVSDDFRNSRWGNRIPFITLGGIIMGLILTLTFGILSIFGANLFVLIFLFAGIYIALGSINAPYNALLSELFEKNMRGWAALTRMVFGGLGTGIAIFVFPPLIDSGNYEATLLIIAIVLFLCAGLVALFVPKLNPDFEPDETISDILHTPQLLWQFGKGDFGRLMICQIFWSLGLGAIYYFWAAYFIYKFDISAEETASILILLSVGAALAAIPIGISVSVIGKVNTGILSSLLFCIFVFLVASAPSLEAMGWIMLFGGIPSMGLSTVRNSLPADLTPEGKEAQFMGINTVSSLFPDPITLAIASVILMIFGENIGFQIIFSLVILEVLAAAIVLTFISYEEWVTEKYNDYYTRFLRAKNKLPDRTWVGTPLGEYFETNYKENASF